MRGRSGLFMIGFVALLLLLLSAAMARHEARPFLLRVQPASVRIAAAKAAAASPSPVSALESLPARVVRLSACTDATRGLAGTREMLLTTLREITRGCLAIAKAIVQWSPLESNSWFVAAVLSTDLGEFDHAGRYLEASYLTGPNDQWIAERRALFFYPLRNSFEQGIGERIDQDLALLLRTERGLDVLSSLYLTDAGMRDHMISIAESLDEDVQNRFLDRIRSQMRAVP